MDNSEITDRFNEISLDDNNHYIYLLQTREFIRTNEPVYKLGRTSNARNRLSSYPKGSEILFLMKCTDCKVAERELLIIFKKVFIKMDEYGAEYFYGPAFDMIRIIGNYFFRNFDTNLKIE